MIDSQKIPFNFTYFAMKLLGKNLYSNPWTAVSEIVANGIDAGADNVYVLIDMHNKEKAVVEIFDDGTGMSVDDLSQKYTLIGRNKRLENDNRKGKTLGRKGIGKLAALYLSPKYYLYTKTIEGQSSWVVDTQGILDSDVPALTKTVYNTDHLISQKEWNSLKTGTMIHLSDVDLRKIGPERLKSLPVMLADYYLETAISSTILVCIVNDEHDRICFKKIQKHINFDTMYGIFDNTKMGYKNKLQSKVYLTRNNVDPAVDYPRNTVKLDENKYICKGTLSMMDLQGKARNVPFEMMGWIGIHSSLDNAVLTRNSNEAKRIQNHPNALRLYVRGKLAVNNLMNYVGSTAAFASYIEGEISFDVLDDDMFEDAATSNREGYSVSDPRIKKLVEIVNRIITSLIIERNKAGNIINEELKAIKRAKEEEAEVERKKREDAERLAATEKINAEKASEAKRQAENERDTVKAEFAQAHNRLFVLENNFTADGETYKHAIHLSVNFAKEIRSLVSDFEDLDVSNDVMNVVMNIDLSAAKIENLPKFVDSATFSLSSPKIKADVLQMIKEYLETKGNTRLKYSFDIQGTVTKEVDFPEILMFLENLVSNSVKANASVLVVKSKIIDEQCQIDFIDDGRGLASKYVANPQTIFRLGETTTPEGFGIGAFHMKEIVERLEGSIEALPAVPHGLIIRVVL